MRDMYSVYNEFGDFLGYVMTLDSLWRYEYKSLNKCVVVLNTNKEIDKLISYDICFQE